MKPYSGVFLLIFSAFLIPVSAEAAQSSSAAGQSNSDKPVAQSSEAVTQNQADKTKRKPKKVWTNDEISTVGGSDSISVVGNSDADSKPPSKENSRNTANGTVSEKQIAAYRERLHQLHNELEITEKKISDLRNFKADNTGASGGINMNRGYSMTPVGDQVKSLEQKKKQIQSQIDAIEDQARKNGVEPGQLR
jgi:uncharacterized protein (UPF0335 family)